MITRATPTGWGLRGASPRSARSLAIRATPAIRCGTSSAATTSPRPYALRGRLRCGLCQRRLQGQWVRGEAYYRCRYPAEYAHSAHLDHPGNVYLRETDLVPKLDAWLARLVRPASPGRLPAQTRPPPRGAGGRRRPAGHQPVDRRHHPAATPSPAHTPPAP